MYSRSRCTEFFDFIGLSLEYVRVPYVLRPTYRYYTAVATSTLATLMMHSLCTRRPHTSQPHAGSPSLPICDTLCMRQLRRTRHIAILRFFSKPLTPPNPPPSPLLLRSDSGDTILSYTARVCV